jgi:3-methyladenine DNA glycosylase AlkD
MIDQIGETAGVVWKYLKENGDTSIPKLIKNLKSDDFLITAALGWLAREDKIEVFVKGRSKAVRLK